MKIYLNASEVAKLLNIDRATVTQWIRKGVIKAAKRPLGTQHWRIPLTAYEELVKGHHESREL
jgi:excisionase family DNA binding protein